MDKIEDEVSNYAALAGSEVHDLTSLNKLLMSPVPSMVSFLVSKI